MKNKSSILIAALFFPICAFSQVGVQTSNPQGTFHVDGAKDNPATGVPTATQQDNDITVSKTGSVGVGTITPAEKMDVGGAITFKGQAVANRTGAGTIDYGARDILPQARILSWGPDATTEGVISFWTGVAGNPAYEKMRVHSNGNVGIGTKAPAQKLHVEGTARITGSTGTATGIMGRDANGDIGSIALGSGLSLSGGTLSTTGSAVAVNIYNADGTLTGNRVVTQGDKTLAFNTTSTNGFSVDGSTFSVDAANDRVGVGTATPTEKLDVTGAIAFKGQAASNKIGTGAIDYANYTVSPQTRILSWGNNASTDGIISFWTGLGGVNAAEKMRIHSNGNVGIGTVTPEVKLDVAQSIGTSEATQLRIINTSPVAVNNTAFMGFNSYNGGGANWGIGSIQNGTSVYDSSFQIMYAGGAKYNKFVTIKPSGLTANATPLFGIGTTTPTNKLDLGEDVGSSITDLGGKKLAVYNNNIGTDFYGLGISENTLQIHAGSTNTEAPGMVLSSYGNVGIGTTAPTNTLHVKAVADPLKLEGVQNGTGENLVIDANGVVKKGPASSSYEVLFDLGTLPAATMSDSNPNGDDTRPAVAIQSQTITLTKDALVQINYSVPIWNVVKYGTGVAPTDGGSKMLRTQLVVDNGIATRSTNVYSNSSTGTGTGTSPEALKGIFYNTGSYFVRLTAGTHTIKLEGTCNPYIVCNQGGQGPGARFQAVAMY